MYVHVMTNKKNVKRYTCGYCRTNFLDKGELVLHMTTEHDNDEDEKKNSASGNRNIFVFF